MQLQAADGKDDPDLIKGVGRHENLPDRRTVQAAFVRMQKLILEKVYAIRSVRSPRSRACGRTCRIQILPDSARVQRVVRE